MRGVHRTHRISGNALAVLIAIWFASGAVMVFSGYPRLRDDERLATAGALAQVSAPELPYELARWIAGGALATGGRARLSMLEGGPVWTYTEGDERRALHALPPYAAVEALDADRARLETERRFGVRVRELETLDISDQWTVSRRFQPYFPLFRVALADADGSEIYLSARSGEVVQASSRAERALAWLGAIPHWIYPAALVRHREIWRMTVLVLAGVGLVLSLSGLAAGVHIAWITRNRPRGSARNPYLRWHQRIGLAFGALASTWLLSGALSLEPFNWTGDGPSQRELEQIYGQPPSAAGFSRVADGLSACRRRIEVREAELSSFAGRAVLSCRGPAGARAVVDLGDPVLEPRAGLPPAHIQVIAERLAGPQLSAAVSSHDAPDDYYYPTHNNPEFARPYARVDISDSGGSTFYLDPASASLVRHTTRAKRLERWLYNGLHSLDFAALYHQPMLWKLAMMAAMLLGFVLSSLGLMFTLTRARPRSERRVRNSEVSEHSASDVAG